MDQRTAHRLVETEAVDMSLNNGPLLELCQLDFKKQSKSNRSKWLLPVFRRRITDGEDDFRGKVHPLLRTEPSIG